MPLQVVRTFLVAAAIIGCHAVPPLPRYPTPGERPPGVMKMYYGQLDLLGCEYEPPVNFDKPYLLERLYGRHFIPGNSTGKGSIVVLGAHNSGTSMVTRLIMLLGAFGGNFETVSIHKHNKLKYYEPFVVSLFHDAFLGKFVDTRFRPYHGQGLNFTTMTQDDQNNLDCFAEKVMKDLNRHNPWVMKDPRMALVMPLWRAHITDLVCVFVHKDPVKNSISLASNGKKSSQTGDTDMMTPQRWLDLWESTMRNGLEGCKGAPTIMMESHDIIGNVEGSLAKLKGMLEGVGVKGLIMPDQDEIDEQIKSYIRTGERVYHVNEKAQKRLNLTANPKVDTTPPAPTTAQIALDEALQEQIRRSDRGDIIDPYTVAESVLNLTEVLAEERERREQERTAAGSAWLRR